MCLVLSSVLTIVFRLIEFDGDGALLELLGVIQHTVRPQMFVFFYLGYLVRNCLLYSEQGYFIKKGNIRNAHATPVFLVVYAVVEVFMYFNYNSVVDAGIYLVMNLCLVIIITGLFSSGIEIRNNALEFIGRNSQPIYLWHVAAILIIKHVIGTDRIFIYYLVNAVAFIAEALAVWVFNNIPFVRKYFFGNLK